MSKSLGNFVEIEQLQAYAAKYSLDAVRWYLLTQGPLHAQDADFSHSKFIEVYNADLANGIGNCASRVANMIEKYFGGKVPAASPVSGQPDDIWYKTCKSVLDLTLFQIHTVDVADLFWKIKVLVNTVDSYIADQRPFSLAKDPANLDKVGFILYDCAETLRIASILLSPAMPEKMAALQKLWNCTPPAGATLEQLCTFGGQFALKPGQMIAKGDALFMRADPAEAPPAWRRLGRWPEHGHRTATPPAGSCAAPARPRAPAQACA